jgi:hypothetical protein
LRKFRGAERGDSLVNLWWIVSFGWFLLTTMANDGNFPRFQDLFLAFFHMDDQPAFEQ